MTAPDARDELREVREALLRDELATAMYVAQKKGAFTIGQLADALLPVVTAWAEKQARARAAGELLYAAQVVRIEHGTASTAAKIIDGRAAALSTGDPA